MPDHDCDNEAASCVRTIDFPAYFRVFQTDTLPIAASIITADMLNGYSSKILHNHHTASWVFVRYPIECLSSDKITNPMFPEFTKQNNS